MVLFLFLTDIAEQQSSETMSVKTSFPAMHKVVNVDIFVQLLMEINWKQLRVESVSMQICIVMVF